MPPRARPDGAGQCPEDALRHLLALHVSDMCFTFSTFRVWELPEVPAEVEAPADVLLGLVALLGVLAPAADALPVIATSCPTCLLSFEVSP
jgi:hypothetical protein